MASLAPLTHLAYHILMKWKKLLFIILFLISLVFSIGYHNEETALDRDKILAYTVDLSSQEIDFFWKSDTGQRFGNIRNLKAWLEDRNEKLLFATNGGIYKTDGAPEGLFIQNGQTISSLNTLSGDGNFYMQPNGVFFVTNEDTAFIAPTADFVANTNIIGATQSGPMLLTKGEINPLFASDSDSLYIRNGVGLLPDGKVIFAISKEELNFYDFADYFKSLGCKEALYLDGFVSRSYLPEEDWIQLDGDLGPLIGVTEKEK